LWIIFIRKLSWVNFKIVSQHLLGGIERNYEKPQSVWPVCGPRFETGTPACKAGVLINSIMMSGMCLRKHYKQNEI
jgi:hypothetical protein